MTSPFLAFMIFRPAVLKIISFHFVIDDVIKLALMFQSIVDFREALNRMKCQFTRVRYQEWIKSLLVEVIMMGK